MAIYQPKSVQKADDTTGDAQVAALRSELEREQERLRKLWDAFRVQEDELNRLKAATPTTALAAGDGRASESLRREIDLLTGDLRRAAEAQKRLEDENQELRDNAKQHAEVARRIPLLEAELAEERERLAKLYAVYEEVETERVKLAGRLKEWDAWFHGAAPHIEELARSIHGAPHAH